MKRYEVGGYDFEMFESETGDYVLYDEVQPILRILAINALLAHKCSYWGDSEPCATCLIDMGKECGHNTTETCGHYNKCQCPACTIAREVLK